MNGKIWVLSTINYLFYHDIEGIQGQRAFHLPILVTGAGFLAAKNDEELRAVATYIPDNSS